MEARDPLRSAGRLLLGGVLVFAGISHLSIARKTFRAQVPDWVPLDSDLKRGIRLLGQPLLIALALWSTGALRRQVNAG